ncbi:unnamed protein product, partial [Pylaiella littoralis]
GLHLLQDGRQTNRAGREKVQQETNGVINGGRRRPSGATCYVVPRNGCCGREKLHSLGVSLPGTGTSRSSGNGREDMWAKARD